MISSEDVERAIDYLRDYAHAAAKARAERLYLEAYVKTELAREMAKHAELPIAAQEREARMSVGYLDALQAYREAIEQDERIRFMRSAAEAKVQAWQTMSANERATRI